MKIESQHELISFSATHENSEKTRLDCNFNLINDIIVVYPVTTWNF